MENMKSDIDGQLLLFQKKSDLEKSEDFFTKYSRELRIDMYDVFGRPLDEMDRKCDDDLFSHKSLK